MNSALLTTITMPPHFAQIPESSAELENSKVDGQLDHPALRLIAARSFSCSADKIERSEVDPAVAIGPLDCKSHSRLARLGVDDSGGKFDLAGREPGVRRQLRAEAGFD